MNIKKIIAKVFSANFIQLIANALVGFIVPSILSIEGYAEYKTYTLFVTYLGLLHFGFPDGMYIKYGGKILDDNKISVKGEFCFFIILEIIISIIIIILGIVLKSVIMILLGLTIIPYMISTFFKTIYQAFGEFEKYTKIVYFYSLSFGFINIIIALLFKNTNYIIYCFVTIIANFVSTLYCLYLYKKRFTSIKIIFDYEYLLNIKIGFFILIGNLSSLLFYALDRWIVKFSLSNVEFAYYSFAANLVGIYTTMINAVSISFYNYFFKVYSKEMIKKIKEILLIFGAASSCGFFIISFIVNLIIAKYVPSLDIIAITFATFPYMIIINSIYLNIYKVSKKEKKYSLVVIFMLFVSGIYDIIALVLFHNIIAIASATLIAFITWFVFSGIDLKDFVIEKKDIIFLIVNTSSFLVISHQFNIFLGIMIYAAIVLLSSFIIYQNTVFYIINDILNFFKTISKRNESK